MRLEHILLIASITVSTYCKPQPQGENDRYAKILSNEYAQQSPYEYSFKFETSNGISVAETGQFEETGYEMGNLVKTGFYHYRGADGKYYLVTYIADKNGYRPTVYVASNTPLNHVLPLVSRPAANYVPKNIFTTTELPEVDEDRIGTKLLISLGGGGILPIDSRPAAGYVSKVVPNVFPNSVPSFAPSSVTKKVTSSVSSTATTSTPSFTKTEADTITQKQVTTTELPEGDEDRIGTKLLISLGGGGIKLDS